MCSGNASQLHKDDTQKTKNKPTVNYLNVLGGAANEWFQTINPLLPSFLLKELLVML